MKTTVFRLLLVLLAGLTGCAGSGPDNGSVPVEDHTHGGGEAVTLWTGTSELFFEYPPMIAGEAGEPWAIHLTYLEDFQPVREGKLTLRFVDESGREHDDVSERPARDGIFTPAPSLPIISNAMCNPTSSLNSR